MRIDSLYWKYFSQNNQELCLTESISSAQSLLKASTSVDFSNSSAFDISQNLLLSDLAINEGG